MASNDIFNYATIAMLLPWALIILLPRGKYTEQVAFLAVFTFILAAIWVIWKNIAEGRNEGDLFSLDGLSRFIQNRDMMLAGWLNYLAFSLCAGIWQINDSREIKLAHLLVIPGLIFTLFAGPIGLLVYFVFRRFKTGAWHLR